MDTQNNLGTVLDFEIPDFYNAYDLTSYGGLKVAIYKSKIRHAYFYTPLILVDWHDFKNELDRFKLDATSEEIVDISIVIQHSDIVIERELINKIRVEQQLPDNSSLSLNLLPFKFFKLYAKIGSHKIWINEDDLNSLTPEDTFTTQLTLMHERAYPMRATYCDLVYFYEKRRTNLIWANLYSDGSPYSTTTISAIATFLNNTENTKKLFGDESVENKTIVESSSSGGGASISLGPFSAGVGSTDSSITTNQSKKRLFNRTYFADYFENNKSSLNLVVDGDTNKYSQLIDKFVDKLFENKSSFEIRIDASNKDAVVLMGDQIAKSTLTLGKSKAILKSKPIIDVSNSQKVEVPVKGVPTKVDKEQKIKTEDDIEWTLEGDEYIPTKVDLKLFNEGSLKDEFSSLAILFTRETKKNTITPFLYPAVWLAKNENYVAKNITDKDNPIGSILAFAGAKNDAPEGWLVCDGTPLDKHTYSELFKIIGYKWGGSDPLFKIPNLEGQFLRGVDYSKNTDPDVDKRLANGEGKKDEVGSFQMDEFQVHSHYYNGRSNGGYMSGDGTSHPQNSSQDLVSYSGGSTETRPKNAYVNFIIRIK